MAIGYGIPDCSPCDHTICRYCGVGHGEVSVDSLTRECQSCTDYFATNDTLEKFLLENEWAHSHKWEGKHAEVLIDNPRRTARYMSAYCTEELAEWSLRKEFDTLWGLTYTEQSQQ